MISNNQLMCDVLAQLLSPGSCSDEERCVWYSGFFTRYVIGYLLSSVKSGFLLYALIVFINLRTLRWRLLLLYAFWLYQFTMRVSTPTTLSCCYDFYYVELVDTFCYYNAKIGMSVLTIAGVMSYMLNRDFVTGHISSASEKSIFYGVGLMVLLLIYPFILHFDLYMSIYSYFDYYVTIDQAIESKAVVAVKSLFLFGCSVIVLFTYYALFFLTVFYLTVHKYQSAVLNGLYVPATFINVYSLCLGLVTTGDWVCIYYFLFLESGTLCFSFIYWWYYQSWRLVHSSSVETSLCSFHPVIEETAKLMESVPTFCLRRFCTYLFHSLSKTLSREALSTTEKTELINLMDFYVLPNADINSFTVKHHYHALQGLIDSPDLDVFLLLHKSGAGYRIQMMHNNKSFLQIVEEKVSAMHSPPTKQERTWLAIYHYLEGYRNNSLVAVWMYDRQIGVMNRMPMDLLREVVSFLG